MRPIVAAVMLFAVWMCDGALVADSPSPCSFNLSREQLVPEIAGAPDVTARARVMSQPDSPLAIVRVDLSGMNLVAAPGWFERSGRHALDVRNVSDQVLTDAEVMVRVVHGAEGRSGVGFGTKAGRPLKPGEQTRIEWKSGTGTGTSGTTDDVSVVAMVVLVKTSRCTYRPSQAWPHVDPSR